MAEPESPTMSATQEETGSEHTPSAPESPHVEHVALDGDDTTVSHEDEHAVDADHDVAEMNQDENPAASASAKPTIIPKSPTKSIAGRASVPSSPVKKLSSSGPSGPGIAKAGSNNPTAGKNTTTASPIKKTTSMSGTATAKPVIPPARASVAAPTRRASMAPPKSGAAAPAPAKSLTGTSATSKATPAVSRTPVTSPTSATAAVAQPRVPSVTANKPRASMTAETMTRTASGRQSSASVKAPSVKAPTPTPKAPGPTSKAPFGVPKPTRSSTMSVSSMKEVKGSGTVSPELQQKLKDAEEILAAKTASLEALEADCARLTCSLKDMQSLTDENKAQMDALQAAKEAAEKEVTTLKEKMEHMQGEDTARVVQLEAVRRELETAKITITEQSGLVKSLQAQIEALDEKVVSARANLEALQATNEATFNEAVASASADRAALLKAQSDFAQLQKEMESLQATHQAALRDLEAQLKTAEEKAARTDALEVEVAQLQSAREENAQRLSELEIEVLELNESKEVAEDERSKILVRVQTLEAQLSKSATELQRSIEAAEAREKVLAEQREEVEAAHAQELEKLKAEHSTLESLLQSLRIELTDAQALYEQSKQDAIAAANNHASVLEEAAKAHAAKEEELLSEIRRVQTDLDSQESKYNAKVAEVKAEHEDLLQEAFERAKSEAGAAHGQDLSSLRAASDATLEQITTSHRATIDALRAEHDDQIKNMTRDFEKQINNLSIELKAAREDLIKTKAALDTVRAEGESAKTQLNELRGRGAAEPSVPQEIIDEIERLTKEVSRRQDDLDAANEALELTKASLSEMSNNHSKELEETARSRASEIAKIGAEHDKELNQLVEQKTELQIRLSDMETELNTVKAAAAAAAQSPASPKMNGQTAAQSNDENLQRLHEAHNLKVQDLTAEHNRREKTLLTQIEELEARLKASQADVEHVKLEMHYLQQDNDESQETITRLQAELDEAKARA